jgi:hypothetical protein
VLCPTRACCGSGHQARDPLNEWKYVLLFFSFTERWVADFPATTCVSLGVSLEGDDHKDRVISGERVTDPVSSLCTWPSAQVGFSMPSFFFLASRSTAAAAARPRGGNASNLANAAGSGRFCCSQSRCLLCQFLLGLFGRVVHTPLANVHLWRTIVIRRFWLRHKPEPQLILPCGGGRLLKFARGVCMTLHVQPPIADISVVCHVACDWSPPSPG